MFKEFLGILFVWSIGSYGVYTEITEKQYAKIPEVFHYDNFDQCMMLENDAFFCSLTYELEPIDQEQPSETWNVIKNLSDVKTNYRHDHIRRWICVPTACPGIKPVLDSDPNLKKNLTDCLDKQFEPYGVKGTIAKLSCESSKSKYQIDTLDVCAALLFLSYFTFILYSTIVEGVARYKSQEEYAKLSQTKCGKLVLACSITRNWIRLKTINTTTEIEKLRQIQGLRVYNTALVVLSHTILGYLSLPVSNTRYPELMHQKFASLFLASGPLCVATFFFISSFLLSNGIFDHLKEKKMSFKTVIFILANRLFRLTPTVFATVLFHATILRHLGSGPNWDIMIGNEYKRCRKQGWTNILYINNWLQPHNMCLAVTWYLALDTQYFVISLFLIWMVKSYEKHAYQIFGTTILINVVGTFLQNYYHDYTGLEMPTAEKYYELRHITLEDSQYQHQLCSFIGNMAAPVVGLMYGYYFHKHKNDEVPLFNTKFRVIIWWFLTWGLGLTLVLVPGAIILNENTEHNIFWASLFVALSRPVFAFVIGTGIYGVTEGVGWLSKRALEWGPTYVLGRLTFSAYLIHMSLILMRPALARFPPHISDFQIFWGLLGDLGITYVAALLLALTLELPLSEMQKMLFGVEKTPKEEVKVE